MDTIPYDQRLARVMVRPLARLGVHPNHGTALTLVMGVAAAWLFAQGTPVAAHWGAGLFVLARFLDHFDGELARQTGRSSRFGYYFDYMTGGARYALLFLGIGAGLSTGPLGAWSWVLGAGGAGAALLSLVTNLAYDKQRSPDQGKTEDYPRFGGFELEDGIYLIAPVTWVGWLTPFFVAAGIGALVYCLWTVLRLLRPGS
jgi:phosphatidylglycerophosphate synthase